MRISSANQIELVRDIIKPSEKQLAFLEAIRTHQYVLYGGAAGGGKSYILRWWLVKYLMELASAGIPGATVGLFCEDYPSLSDRQISKIRFEFPDWLGHLSLGATKDFVLHERYGGGRIALRNLDDPSKYLSAEFAGIAVDELTRNKRDVFDFLRLRLRWPGVEQPRFAGGSNPGGRGHGWVKDIWIDKKFPAELQPLASEFAYVQAKASDNPHLTASYYENLKTLPKAMADAYAEGRWDLFIGQYFDIFEPARHVMRAEQIGIEPWWPKWISIDWGFDHPAAVYWHTTDSLGRHYTYRELVVRRLSPKALGEAIVAASVDRKNQTEKIQCIYLGPDAYAKRTDEATIAEQLDDVFQAHKFPSPAPADNDRVGGWMQLYQLLESDYWVIADSCPELIRVLPTLTRDEKNVEDILKINGDDPADSARYGMKSHLAPGKKPIEQRIAERVTATDPTSRAIWMKKFEREESRKVSPEIPRRWRPQRGPA